jgi:hypothetical protein
MSCLQRRIVCPRSWDALANHQLRSVYVGMALAAELTQESAARFNQLNTRRFYDGKGGNYASTNECGYCDDSPLIYAFDGPRQ